MSFKEPSLPRSEGGPRATLPGSLLVAQTSASGMQGGTCVPNAPGTVIAAIEKDGTLYARTSAVSVVSGLGQLQEANKFDAGKLPLELVPFDAVEGIAEILQFGAKKYAPRNWELGMSWGRIFGACLRHLWAWWMKRGNDTDTGKSHLLHAGCCILFLIAYELRNVGKDDRP